MTKPTALERFLSKIEVDPATDCWLWTAGLANGGYGKFKANGRTHLAHRWYYEDLYGAVPAELQLDHLCRVRACVNPNHLEPVTGRENLLRGDTFQAANAAKTHCPKGHPLAGDNLLVSGARRYCRTCRRAQTAAWRAAHLEEARRRDRENKKAKRQR